MKTTRNWIARALVIGALIASTQAGAEVVGTGASFPSQVYSRWASAYAKKTGSAVSYRATGSGEGVKLVTARAVGFGGTDSPLPAHELAQRKLVQLPMLVGGIVPVVNVPGVAENKLQLSGELLADIMAGKVKSWNDARIAGANPGLNLPNLAIKRIVRADRSGTSEGLTRYLAGASAQFKTEVGIDQQPKWPGDVERADGNDGVVKALRANSGAIAYVSFDRAQHDNLTTVKLRNADGKWVAASEAGFRAALAESDIARRGDDAASLIDRPGATSWPITQASFVLVDAEPPKSDLAASNMRFLYWCFVNGDNLTKGTGFAALPANLQSKVAARFTQVSAQDKKPVDYMAM